MIKLLEPVLLIKVREQDQQLARSLIKHCEREFSEIMKRETTRDYECTLQLVEEAHLTDAEGGALGGVILYSEDRRIVCPNTLQNRMDLCFEELLPAIRQ